MQDVAYFRRHLLFRYVVQVTGRVTHSVSMETANHSSSVMAEKDGFVKCLEEAKRELDVESVTTDGNISIRAYMKNIEKDVSHGLDVWHLCKNLTKNLHAKARKKVCRPKEYVHTSYACECMHWCHYYVTHYIIPIMCIISSPNAHCSPGCTI